MKLSKNIDLPGRDGITVYGDGEIDIIAMTGYEDITVSFSLDELELIVKQVNAYKNNLSKSEEK